MRIGFGIHTSDDAVSANVTAANDIADTDTATAVIIDISFFI